MSQAPGHFRRYRSFVLGGWQRAFKPSEAALWHAIEAHADAAGLAFPSLTTIAALLGEKNPRRIRAIRRILVAHKLLEVVHDGTGQEKRYIVRVLIPPLLETSAVAETVAYEICTPKETESVRAGVQISYAQGDRICTPGVQNARL